MTEINLLPTEFRANKDVAKAASVLSRLAVAAGVIFLLIGLVGGAAFYFLNSSVQKSQTTQAALRAEITGLESSEQAFVLIKDRLQKAQSIMAERTKFKQFEFYKDLVENLPEDTRFSEEELDATTSKITLITPSSRVISEILQKVEVDQRYQKVKIESLDFDPSKGYELIMNIF